MRHKVTLDYNLKIVYPYNKKRNSMNQKCKRYVQNNEHLNSNSSRGCFKLEISH
jgi:hypothetical protein